MPVSRGRSHVRVLAMFLILCGMVSVGRASAQATDQAVPLARSVLSSNHSRANTRRARLS
jgi:hypothetical protein